MKNAVVCEKITKSFRTGESETFALQEANLVVPQASFSMLVGPSGCGKTTFISIIAGILHQDSGTCIVEERNYQHLTAEDLIDFRAKNVGFIFQSFHLIPTLSVAENVSIPLIINQVPREDALKIAKDMLRDVGLYDKSDHPPLQLSGGQQQRVAIARALVHNPALVICDEPTSALDHTTGEKILELMKTINRKRKTTFLIVTHDARIYTHADIIAYMDDGKVIKVEER